MRRHSEYTRRLCRLYSTSKASASPCCARSIASASESLSPCFLASVKSPFPAALSQMRHKCLFVVLLAVRRVHAKLAEPEWNALRLLGLPRLTSWGTLVLHWQPNGTGQMSSTAPHSVGFPPAGQRTFTRTGGDDP